MMAAVVLVQAIRVYTKLLHDDDNLLRTVARFSTNLFDDGHAVPREAVRVHTNLLDYDHRLPDGLVRVHTQFHDAPRIGPALEIAGRSSIPATGNCNRLWLPTPRECTTRRRATQASQALGAGQ